MPVHLCACGCGQPTALARKTQASRGWIKGQPLRYLPHHNNAASRRPKVKPYPSSAELWRHPERSWAEWQALTGIHEWTLRRWCNEQGWRRSAWGRWTQAPCEECGAPFQPKGRQAMQRCEDCQCVLDFTPAPVAEAVPEWKRMYEEGKALHERREAARKAGLHEAVARMTAQPLTAREWAGALTPRYERGEAA